MTAVVVTVNAVLVRPAGTVTWADAVAAGLLLAIVTGVPPDGAAATRVTVQEVLDPPVTELGEQTTEETAGWVTTGAERVIEKLRELLPSVAVTTADVCVLTAVVVTVKFAVDDPEFTVTELGTVAFPLLLCSDTLVLLVAFPLNVTVHVEVAGGVMLAGLQLKLDSTIAGFNVSVNG